MSNYVARITRVSDGVTVEVDFHDVPYGIYSDSEEDLFWWTEGSCGCNCNRSLWFYMKLGVPEPESQNTGICTGHGDFTVLIITDEGKTFGPL